MSVCALRLWRRDQARFWCALGMLLLLLVPSLGWAAKCPNVQIVLDRSFSMVSMVSGGASRWDIAKQSINSAVALADPVRLAKIGLQTFPAAACDSALQVRPDYGTKSAIETKLSALSPAGSTPSGTAIRDTVALTELKDATRKQYIVLLTDGVPACSGEPDSAAGTVGEIKKGRMSSPSIGTFVVGVGDGFSASDMSTLGLMADAGGYADPTPLRYYPGKTASELYTSMLRIMQTIQTENASCSDVVPADMAMPPMDLSVPPMDLHMPPMDLYMPPSTDLSVPPMDLHMPPSTDLSVPPMDLYMPPSTDLTMTPMDLTMTTMDLAVPPADLTMATMDLSGVATDMAIPSGSDAGVVSKLFVEWISPREIEQGKSGPAVVRGTGFAVVAPGASVYLEGSSGLHALANVLVEDEKTIKVFVPADLAVGSYDVVVKNPDGAIARLAAGFAVTAVGSGGCSCDVTGGRSVSPSSLWCGLLALVLTLRRVRSAQRVRVGRAG